MRALEEALLGPLGPQRAKEALALALSLGLPGTPKAYEVWLAYVLDINPQLREVIDAELKVGVQFTLERVNELHKQFFANDALDVHVINAGEQISRELASILEVLASAATSNEKFADRISNTAKALEKTTDLAKIRSRVGELGAASAELAAENRSLAQKLSATSIEVSSLRQSLKDARTDALQDALTGVANRKMFDTRLHEAFDAAVKTITPLTLMMVDIDHFKRFNDTWGHQTGDQIIRFVGSVLQKTASADHIVARYGGEEFAIVMPKTGLQEAHRIAEAARVAISSKRLYRRSTNEELGLVTASFGIAQIRRTDSVSSLIERADEALYTSKRNGRNRVTIETPLQPAA